jgi:RHS repeat-associated protein
MIHWLITLFWLLSLSLGLASIPASISGQLSGFLRGQDLSGTMDGAGGIGGLVGVSEVLNNTVTSFHFAAYNGNVATLVRASDQAVSAHYEYAPFGKTLRATGVMSKFNPFRFSTKFADDETELVYYGYRYYSPSLGRRISRDPFSPSMMQRGKMFGDVPSVLANASEVPMDYYSSPDTK